MTLAFHPASEIFPLLDGKPFAELLAAAFQAEGFTARETARLLNKSPDTVGAQLLRARRKLGVRNGIALAMALRRLQGVA